MKIIKVFNTNAVLVRDGDQEKIVTGKGVGFGKGKNDLVSPLDVERVFVTNEEKNNMEQLLSQIKPEYFQASEEIIDYAEEFLGERLNKHIHIALADHIAFAVERLQADIVIQNKLLKEIEILYPEEFSIAEWAINFLRKKFELVFPLDEAGYIAIHLHSSRHGEIGTKKSIREITIISAIVEMIADELQVNFDDMKLRLNYSRLVTHLRFVMERMYHDKFHSMDEEVLGLITEKYQRSYLLAQRIAKMVRVQYNETIPKEELGYLTLHIERLASQLNGADNGF